MKIHASPQPPPPAPRIDEARSLPSHDSRLIALHHLVVPASHITATSECRSCAVYRCSCSCTYNAHTHIKSKREENRLDKRPNTEQQARPVRRAKNSRPIRTCTGCKEKYITRYTRGRHKEIPGMIHHTAHVLVVCTRTNATDVPVGYI